MQIDQDRIRAILKAEHSFYGYLDIPIRRDDRWSPQWENLIAPQLSPAMHVLDVGCGKGHFLLDFSARFHTGLGIDNDPAHVQMAEEAKHAEGIHNVEFRLLDFPGEVAQLKLGSFDMVVSIRGPVLDTEDGLEEVYRLLRPDGLLFCEEIAEHHQKEVVEIFSDRFCKKAMHRRVDEIRALMEHKGFNVRLAADFFSKWLYPDVYAWVAYISNLWTWLGIPLPEPDDPRIALFAERNTIETGEIETTHHVALIASVKR
jgi:SAM-dependent methyltransferase